MNRWFPPLILVLYAVLNLLVISPAGNFPLNDDWIYSESVFHLLKTGEFHLLGCSPACLLHVWMGSLACLAFGFSHEVLRSTNVFFSLIAALVLYASLVELGLRRRDSVLLALILQVNPIFVNVTYSFMTDIPALMFAGLYTFFTIAALKRQSYKMALLAGVMLCFAILVRQTYLALAGCNFLLALFTSKSRKLQLSLLVSGVVAPIAVALAAENFMAHCNTYMGVYTYYKDQFRAVLISFVTSPVYAVAVILERLFKIFCYLGLFLIPFLPAAISAMAKDFKEHRNRTLISITVGALVAVPAFIDVLWHKQWMPFSQNLLRIPMVGSMDLMGICVEGLKPRPRIWLTVISAILGLLLLTIMISVLIRAGIALVTYLRKEAVPSHYPQDLILIFASLLLMATLALLSIQVAVFDFDRYYLMALPPLLLILALYVLPYGISIVRPLSVVLLIAIAAYSTLAAQDYLSWNRARWQAIRDLEQAGVSPLEIDGGPQYNFLANPELVKACVFSPASFNFTNRGVLPRSNWRWWPISGEKYIVSFSPVPEYEVVARHRFWGGLTLGEREILTLKSVPSKK